MIEKPIRPVLAAPAIFVACLATVGFAASVLAAEPAPSARDVENARRCAAATRSAGHAFGEVRDSVRAGGTTRAEALLTQADDALAEARVACAGNAEVSTQLDLLAGESQGLRRSLGGR